jgi:hypothetical protein
MSSAVTIFNDLVLVACTLSVFNAELVEPNFVFRTDSFLLCTDLEFLDIDVALVEALVGMETFLETLQSRDAAGCALLGSDEDLLSEDEADESE